ncbi:MAG: hypothetical protein LBT19_00275 [Candidatus Nomurabacteria bacterium]|jgi:hypothetical protein|nr:hypothetical protein [Candidatus Nomurabacteria bacterium]
MNKDVIYIEPEDDITDILTKIKNSKNKIVALVPPKKSSVLRSMVNFKLIEKTARESEKAAVLITTDESLVKLAGLVRMPVAKNLQTKPEVSVPLVVNDGNRDDDVIDGEEAKAIVAEEQRVEKVENGGKTVKNTTEAEAITEIVANNRKFDDEITSEDLDKPEDEKKKKKSAVPDFAKYRKFIIMGIIGLVLIVGFLVWALVFAPAAKISVTVRTTAKNFSETVSFVEDREAADPEAGVFLLEEQKLVKTSKVEFEATGEVDKGAKATGTLTLKRNTTTPVAAIEIPVGTKFTLDGLTYVSTEKATLRAIVASDCTGDVFSGCTGLKTDITTPVKVSAEFAGTKYNIEASDSGWGPTGKGYTISSSAMAGGSTKIVKVVSEADIAKAKQALDSTNESEGRTELLREFPSGLIPIDASFVVKLGDPTATPALDAEVADGVTPTLVAETTFTIFGVDRARIGEYIEAVALEKFSGADLKEVYSTGVSEEADKNKAFIESFREVDKKYTAKLKSTVQIGPEVTDEMVADKSLGKKIGEVQTQLKSINGISSVKVDTSFFWVSSVPKDINKVTVEITVE